MRVKTGALRARLPAFAAAAIISAAALVTGRAQAQTMMRIADYVPATHWLTVQGMVPFMEEVTKETNGALKFQHFPAQQLGKAPDMLRLAQTGVAQISQTGISFAGDAIELSDVTQLAGLWDKACDGLAAYTKLVDAKGPLVQQDFDRNGVHLLWMNVLPPFQVWTRDKPITSLADMKGLKALSPTRAGELLLAKMGATPMKLSSGPQAYESIQRGVADAVVFQAESIFAYDMTKLTKHFVRNSNFGGQLVAVVMNNGVWNGLDQKTKDIVTAAAKHRQEHMCAYLDDGLPKAHVRLVENGETAAEFNAADLKTIAQMSNDLAEEWAKSLDAKGKPGTQVLNDFKAALKK